MPALDRARAEVGLPPARGPARPHGQADRVVVRSSPSYDFGSGSVPTNVCYVGPQRDDEASAPSPNGRYAGHNPKESVLKTAHSGGYLRTGADRHESLSVARRPGLMAGLRVWPG
jgi:hypothetical protein